MFDDLPAGSTGLSEDDKPTMDGETDDNSFIALLVQVREKNRLERMHSLGSELGYLAPLWQKRSKVENKGQRC